MSTVNRVLLLLKMEDTRAAGITADTTTSVPHSLAHTPQGQHSQRRLPAKETHIHTRKDVCCTHSGSA